MAVCMSSRILAASPPNAVEKNTSLDSNGRKKARRPFAGWKSPSFQVGPVASIPSGPITVLLSRAPYPPLDTYPTRPRRRYGGMEDDMVEEGLPNLSWIGGMPSCESQHIRRSVQYAMKSPEVRHADGFCSRSHMIHMIHQLNPLANVKSESST